MNQLMRLMTIGALGLQLSWGAPAAGEKAPGDEFREAALDYERQAHDAIERAIQSNPEEAGRYLQLAVVHRWMADIKRRAAALADQDRWDEMVWDEYHELEAQRDRLSEELHDSQAIEPQDGDRGHDFLVAARDYQAQANAHAGSTPMPGRRDALVAASKMIAAIRDLALGHGPDAVSTVGQLEVIPNSRNTIPGEVRFSVDLRHADAIVLAKLDHECRALCQPIGGESDVSLDLEEIWYQPPVVFDEGCIDAVRGSAEHSGVFAPGTCFRGRVMTRV